MSRQNPEFARLINASPDEVAVTTSVSAATAALASALDFTGDRRTVLATEAEFPTVGHVWLAHRKHGARVAWVPVRDGIVPLDEYEPRLGSDTLVGFGIAASAATLTIAIISAETNVETAWEIELGPTYSGFTWRF